MNFDIHHMQSYTDKYFGYNIINHNSINFNQNFDFDHRSLAINKTNLQIILSENLNHLFL